MPVHLPEPPPGGYATIVIDPPWPYDTGRDFPGVMQTPSPDHPLHYAMMSLWDITALPIWYLAGPQCHLFLWTTQKFLRDAFPLCRRWGFQYRRLMVWHKSAGVQFPHQPSSNAEFILHGTRGRAAFSDTKNFYTCFAAKTNGHSVKPAEFYELLARVTPGPRIDLFARKRHPGFDAWGDQVEPLEETA